jgi:hypothetical protein
MRTVCRHSWGVGVPAIAFALLRLDAIQLDSASSPAWELVVGVAALVGVAITRLALVNRLRGWVVLLLDGAALALVVMWASGHPLPGGFPPPDGGRTQDAICDLRQTSCVSASAP